MPSLVTIVLPIRNGAATLPRAIESCLDQTLRDHKLVVVDDQSSDDSFAVAEEYSRRDARVYTMRCPPPGGLVAALQTGCAAVRSPIIARMDADDWSHPQRLEKQVKLLEQNPSIAACGCQVRIAGNPGEGFLRYGKWINHLVTPDEIARERFVESPLVHPTAVIRRDAFEAAGGYRDAPWAEDYDLWLRMMERGMPLAKVPEVLFDWHDAPARLTRTDPRYSETNFLRAKAHYLARLPAVRRRGVTISGAGPIGKRIARLLLAEGIAVHAFLEINPRRVGVRIAGVPVLASDDMPPPSADGPVQIGAVGRPGRRPALRRLLNAAGYTEGEDFFCLA